MAQELRHQYSLAYEPDDPHHDGTWREIRLTVAKPGLKVTTRRGYYAPVEGALVRPPARKK